MSDLLSEQLFGRPRRFAWDGPVSEDQALAMLSPHSLPTKSILGQALDLEGLLDLCGIPSGSHIQLLDSGWLAGFRVDVQAACPDQGILVLERSLFLDNLEGVLVNWHYLTEGSAQRRGIGARLLAHQAVKAARLGFDRIEAVAVRGEGYTGYYTWPRLGFDGDLGLFKDIIHSAFELETGKELPLEVETVQDLLEVEQGLGVWRQYGGTLEMSFDLAEGSRSWGVHNAYLEENNIGLAALW